jgi:hypothetical protein
VPNKDQERAHLRLVYTEREFDSIEPYDPFPDWILRRPAHPPFGVEVTEFYHSETTARLLKDHSYRTELIRERRYRHKDDIGKAQIVTIEIDPGGPRHFKSEAILVNTPPISEYAPSLAARISKESLRVASSPGHLSHVNLLIMDRDHRLSGTPVQEVCPHLLTPGMRTALIETPYREVFLVTSVEQRGNCFYPLRLLFVASEGFLLNRALKEFYADVGRPDWDWDEEIEVYGEFLRRRGATVGIAVRNDGRHEVLFGNAGFSVSEKGVHIYDNADHPLPRTRPPAPRPENCRTLSPEFLQFFDGWSRRKFFTSGLAYPIAKQA